MLSDSEASPPKRFCMRSLTCVRDDIVVILTIAGILFGSGFGILLHRFIIVTVEVDAVMFGRNINPVSFLYCGLLTIGFSMIVNLFMHQKLKKIDMVESLKSVE